MSTALLNLLFTQTIYKHMKEELTEEGLNNSRNGNNNNSVDKYSKIAQSLRNHPLNNEFNLSPQECQSLYSALLPSSEGRPSLDTLRQLLARVYESYKRDIVVHIRKDEHEYQNKLKEIEQIEKGQWDKELLKELEQDKSQMATSLRYQPTHQRLQRQLDQRQVDQRERERKLEIQRRQLEVQKQLERQQQQQKELQMKGGRQQASKMTRMADMLQAKTEKLLAEKELEKIEAEKNATEIKEKVSVGIEVSKQDKKLPDKEKSKDGSMKNLQESHEEVAIVGVEGEDDEVNDESDEQNKLERNSNIINDNNNNDLENDENIKPINGKESVEIQGDQEENQVEQSQTEHAMDIDIDQKDKDAQIEQEQNSEENEGKRKRKEDTIKKNKNKVDSEDNIKHSSLEKKEKGGLKKQQHHQVKEENLVEEDKNQQQLSDVEPLVKTISLKRKRQSQSPAPTSQRRFQQFVNPLLSDILSNKAASFFSHPVNPNDAPNYYDLIYSPTDLRTIKSQVKEAKIRDTSELERELEKMFANAVMYNGWNSEMSQWARQMHRDTENLLAIFKDAEKNGRSSSNPGEEGEIKRRRK